jgi:hypothetical protein
MNKFDKYNSLEFRKILFIEKAILVHGDFYDYSKVEYVNAHTKVCIMCPIHGEFWQTPSDHLSGRGCSKCAKKCRYTTPEWVEEAIKKHGDLFDYSKVEYINTKTKVCIICKKCGKEFWQKPQDHLRGRGCPHCNRSRLENGVYKILKENNINFVQNHKGFDWLVNPLTNYKLEADFYLSEYNVVIECQGKQHFEVKPHGFFNQEDLDNIQYRDKIKKQLCEEHGLKLFFVNYNDNVEEKMKEIIELMGGIQ